MTCLARNLSAVIGTFFLAFISHSARQALIIGRDAPFVQESISSACTDPEITICTAWEAILADAAERDFQFEPLDEALLAWSDACGPRPALEFCIRPALEPLRPVFVDCTAAECSPILAAK